MDLHRYGTKIGHHCLRGCGHRSGCSLQWRKSTLSEHISPVRDNEMHTNKLHFSKFKLGNSVVQSSKPIPSLWHSMLCLPKELSLFLFGNNINYYLLFDIWMEKKVFPSNALPPIESNTNSSKSQSFPYSDRVFDLLRKHVSINIQIDVVCFCVTQPKWSQTKKKRDRIEDGFQFYYP